MSEINSDGNGGFLAIHFVEIKRPEQVAKERIDELERLLASTPSCQSCLGNPMVTKCPKWCREAKRLRAKRSHQDQPGRERAG